MHGPMNVKFHNNTSKWQMEFNSAFKGLNYHWTEKHTQARTQTTAFHYFLKNFLFGSVVVFRPTFKRSSGPGSSVDIVTGYRLDGPGIEFRWGRDFSHLSRPGPTQSPVQWVPGLSRSKEWPGLDDDPSPLLVSWSWKSRAIPLFPLWAVLPVQSLIACTRVHFNFTLRGLSALS
jgi:hypothetical protein